jgi:hypothetical protein
MWYRTPVNVLQADTLSQPTLRTIISSDSADHFYRTPTTVLSHKSQWFPAIKLVLNPDKINIIKCIKNNSPQYPLSIGYDGKHTEESGNKIFLGLQTVSHLKWNNKTELIISKLCAAHHVAGSMVYISNTSTLKITYFVYLHSIMQYGIVLGGNSSYSKKKSP